MIRMFAHLSNHELQRAAIHARSISDCIACCEELDRRCALTAAIERDKAKRSLIRKAIPLPWVRRAS